MACSLVVGRVQVLESTLTWYINQQTPHRLSLQLDSLTLDTLRIRQLEAEVQTDSGPFQIVAQGVTCLYTLEALHHGRIEEIRVESLHLRLPDWASSAQKHPAPFPDRVQRFFAQVDLADLPAARLTVKQLMIEGITPAVFAKKMSTLQLWSTEEYRTLELRTVLVNRRVLTLTARQRTQGRPRLNLRAALTAPQMRPQEAALTITPAALQLHACFSVSELTNSLGIKMPWQIQGDIRVSAESQWTGIPLFSGEVTAQHLAFKHNTLRSLHLKAAGRLDHWGEIDLLPHTQLLAEDMVFSYGSLDQLRLDLQGRIALNRNGFTLTPGGKTDWQFRALKVHSKTIGRLHIQPRALSLSVQKRHPTLTALADTIAAQQLDLQAISFPEVILSPVIPWQFTVTPDNWTVLPLRATVSPFEVHAPTWRATFQKTTLDLNRLERSANELLWVLQAETEAAEVRFGKHTVPLHSIEAHSTHTGHRIHGLVTLSPDAGGGRVRLTFDHNPETKTGHIQGLTTAPIRLRDFTPLRTFVQSKHLPLELTSGQVKGTLTGSWSHGSPPEMVVTAALEKGAGSIHGIDFIDLEGRESIQLWPSPKSVVPGQWTLGQLNTFLPFQEIRLRTHMPFKKKGQQATISFTDISASAAGGTISAAPFAVSVNTPGAKTTLSLNNIDLAELLAPLKRDDLEVAGRISGTLPLEKGEQGISIENGLLHTDEQGGHIRYQPIVAAPKNKYTAMALRALREFSYSLLQAEVVYHPDGSLLVDVHLQGTSPHLSETRPVHLNIHSEQNVLSLLQSVRYNTGKTFHLDKK